MGAATTLKIKSITMSNIPTKDEILFPLHCHCPEELEMMWDETNAKKAMDEYAKQVAIGFQNWLAGNKYELHNNGFYSNEPPYRDWETDRKSTRLNSSHRSLSRMPSSA